MRARGLALFAVAVHHTHLMAEGLKNHSVASFDCTCCFPLCQTEGKEMAVFLKVLWALSTTLFLNHHITKPCKNKSGPLYASFGLLYKNNSTKGFEIV